jgi:hypothetical protein
MYKPIKKSVLSPRQQEIKDRKKAAKKGQKNSEASKKGKQAKRTGKYAENGVVKLLESWGYKTKSTVMSGQLKTYAETFGKTEETRQMFEGDKWVEIKDKWRMIESKKRTLDKFKSYYSRTEGDKGIIVGRSFVMLSQKAFHQLLLGMRLEYETIEDKRFKTIHDYFAQDNSDIVSLVSKEGKFYKDYIFCLTYELLEELKG